ATVGFSAGWVTRSVFRFHLGVNIAVLGQVRTSVVQGTGLAISVSGGRVVLTVHGHSDGVTSLDVFTHGTGDGHVGLGFSLVDHIVASNGVDRNRSFGQIGIATVATVSFSRSGVTGSVFGLNLGVYIAVLG